MGKGCKLGLQSKVRKREEVRKIAAVCDPLSNCRVDPWVAQGKIAPLSRGHLRIICPLQSQRDSQGATEGSSPPVGSGGCTEGRKPLKFLP